MKKTIEEPEFRATNTAGMSPPRIHAQRTVQLQCVGSYQYQYSAEEVFGQVLIFSGGVYMSVENWQRSGLPV